MFFVATCTLLACASKILGYETLVDALAAARVLPLASLAIVAPLLIFWELLGLLGLAYKPTRVAALLALGLFYAGATAYSAAHLLNGTTGSCGCFPGVLLLSPTASIGLSFMLFATCALCLAFHPKAGAPESKSTGASFAQSLVFVLVCLGVVSAALTRISWAQANRLIVGVPGTEELEQSSALPIRTIQRLHPPDKATAIVFTDLECPGCHTADAQLFELSQSLPNFELEFHHLPLTGIHPDAYRMALVTEMCNVEGRTDIALKLILGDPATVEKWPAIREGLARSSKRDQNLAKAKEIVKRDTDVARELHLNATPTIYLNIRDKYYLVNDISDLPRLIPEFLLSNSLNRKRT